MLSAKLQLICSGFNIITTYQLRYSYYIPENKAHGANMGPSWGREDPGGPHVGPMNFAVWDHSNTSDETSTLKY